ncbi:MAG: class I adenylate-forming enzyme family protein, partial [Verrucomicrobiota bacterium]
MILYQRWLQTLESRGDQTAVIDHEKNEALTFSQMAAALQRLPSARNPVAAVGVGVPFLMETLRAWRDGQVLIPMEKGAEEKPVDLSNVPSGVVHLKMTSGSTGECKRLLFTAEQLAADADQIVATMGLTPPSPNIGVISLAHSYGFSNLVLPLFLHGIPLHLGSNPLPETLRQLLSRTSNATLPAVPVMWKTWLRSGVLESHGHRLRLAISAGAPLRLELEKACFESTGLKIHNFYGASECGGIAFDLSETPRSTSAEVGQPMDGVTITTVKNGRLQIRSAAVALSSVPRDPEAFPAPET